ncbi:MAG: ABC transporter ATP-binding protein [Verrucomicrobia bacterium]|nr:MAG: ABC transporter ATP-binding protein [Verrucomicrobiota bacterium]
MSEPAIHVENLSKKYIIGHQTGQGDGLRHVVERFVRSPLAWLRERGMEKEEFWALKGVNLEVQRGEVVGIIGKNGAGKSTLLKLLSRITEPTEGRIRLKGRVASLLEVGTGFHPELTGRENIFLNGAVLGMSRAEIKQKFDEIVAFAEVDRFLDTPVKRYSSGMYVRLAFAVAAHLEPEILIVDEVLAVGDAAFQAKCLGKMGEVASHDGRTILFVSHNMTAVQSLCHRAVMLDQGKVVCEGNTAKVVQQYLSDVSRVEAVPLDDREDRDGDGSIRMRWIKVSGCDEDGVIRTNSRLRVEVGYEANGPVKFPEFWITIRDNESMVGLFQLNNEAAGGLPDTLPAKGVVRCETAPINLTPGRCFINLGVQKAGVMADYVQYATIFDVEPEDVYGSGKVPSRQRVMNVIRQQWSFEERRE